MTTTELIAKLEERKTQFCNDFPHLEDLSRELLVNKPTLNNYYSDAINADEILRAADALKNGSTLGFDKTTI